MPTMRSSNRNWLAEQLTNKIHYFPGTFSVSHCHLFLGYIRPRTDTSNGTSKISFMQAFCVARHTTARFVGLFYALDIWRSSDKISSGGGQIVSVLPMSFRIEEWKMDPCVIYFLYWRIAEKRRKRRSAVHPIKSARFEDGAFRNPYGKLRDDSDKFFLIILECQ
jgi:hypothetical protein